MVTYHWLRMVSRRSVVHKRGYRVERLAYRCSRGVDALLLWLSNVAAAARDFILRSRYWSGKRLRALRARHNLSYKPEPCEGRVVIVLSEGQLHLGPQRFWGRVAQEVCVCRLSSAVPNPLEPEALDELARELSRILTQASRASLATEPHS